MVARPARQCILQRVLWPVALRAIVGHNYVFQVVIRNNLLGQGSCVFKPEGYSIVQVYIKVFLLMSLPVMGRPMQLQSLSFLVKALHRNWSRFFLSFHNSPERRNVYNTFFILFLFSFSFLFPTLSARWIRWVSYPLPLLVQCCLVGAAWHRDGSNRTEVTAVTSVFAGLARRACLCQNGHVAQGSTSFCLSQGSWREKEVAYLSITRPNVGGRDRDRPRP